MPFVWYQNIRRDLQIIFSCKPAIISNNTSGYTQGRRKGGAGGGTRPLTLSQGGKGGKSALL